MTLDDFPLLERGVYRAPCLGPDGETILYAVRANHRLIGRDYGGVRYVPVGGNPLAVSRELWNLLANLDPEPIPLPREQNLSA
jgi:hypothetical protein